MVQQKAVENPRLDALTGIRFFAAFAVFNFHFLILENWFSGTPVWIIRLRNAGEVGVVLFFMLSGFILANAYSGIASTWHDRKAFWIARFARIYPVYLLCFLWFAPFILYHRYATEPPHLATLKSLSSAGNTLLLVQDWVSPRMGISWNGPSWTLSTEFVFYLCFPWLAPRFRNLSSRGLFTAAISLCIFSFVLTRGTFAVFGHGDLPTMYVTRHPLFHLPTFMAGVALGYLYQRRTALDRTRGDIFALAGVIGILGIAAFYPTFERFVPRTSLYLPVMALLIYGLACGGWSARLLSTRPILLLGEASYALYLMQDPLNATLSWMIGGFRIRDVIANAGDPAFLARPGYYIVILAAALAASIAIFVWIETPARVALRQRLGRRFLHRALPPPVIPVNPISSN
jgi:peptidoglycan/LPS O-acetylase OafA/YrhL